MSLIKDIPCPYCGANMIKVGFMYVLSKTNETTYNILNKQPIIFGGDKYYDQYIECKKCNKRLDVDPDKFIKRVNKMWD